MSAAPSVASRRDSVGSLNLSQKDMDTGSVGHPARLNQLDSDAASVAMSAYSTSEVGSCVSDGYHGDIDSLYG